MNRAAIVIAMCVIGLASSASAQSAWLGGEVSAGRVMPGAAGSTTEAHVGLWLEVPASAAVPSARVPMALSLVIDTSGSMRGEKIEHAREAALRFIDSLHAGDIVSIYAFETTVAEIVAPTLIAPGVRDALAPRIRALSARGNTNLHEGLRRGQEAVARAPESHRIRRVVLISDGIATVQPTSVDALGELASSGARVHIGVAAIGVGSDYDERTLRELAVRSAGRLYHVDSSSELGNVVTAELGLLDRSAATNARLEITPAPGVVVLGADTIGGHVENGNASFDIGTVYAPQTREYLIRARLPTSRVGRHPLAHAVLRYAGATAEEGERREDLVLSYEVTPDLVAVQGSESTRVAALVALHASASTQLSAADSAGRGRRADADRQLARAEQSVGHAAERTRDPMLRARLQREQASIHRRRAAVQAARAPAAQRAASRRVASEALDPWY